MFNLNGRGSFVVSQCCIRLFRLVLVSATARRRKKCMKLPPRHGCDFFCCCIIRPLSILLAGGTRLKEPASRQPGTMTGASEPIALSHLVDNLNNCLCTGYTYIIDVCSLTGALDMLVPTAADLQYMPCSLLRVSSGGTKICRPKRRHGGIKCLYIDRKIWCFGSGFTSGEEHLEGLGMGTIRFALLCAWQAVIIT